MESIHFARPSIERLIKAMQLQIAQLNPTGLDDRIEWGACNNLLQALGSLAGEEFVVMCVDGQSAASAQRSGEQYDQPVLLTRPPLRADHMSLFYGSNDSGAPS
ncbi:hypothetical protein JCM19000A_22250 [Silvimonas sp. JCM 19000]